MILRKAFFICLFGWPLFANMRAPVEVRRGATSIKAIKSGKIEVLAENLSFSCPEVYTGGVNFAHFASAACDAVITYRVRSEAMSVQLAFVYSGTGDIEWQLAGKKFTSKPSPLSPQQKSCPECPQSLEKLQSAVQQLDLAAGENTITIRYRQPLAFRESGHSYFSAGKWRQSFTYELWPIAEWQWAPGFSADLNLSVAARDGFIGIGYKDDSIQCATIADEKQDEVDLSLSKPAAGRRVATARLKMHTKPQRLRCEYWAG